MDRPTAAPFDTQKLDELTRLLGPARLALVLDSFAQEIPALAARIRDAAASGDAGAAKVAAHGMKGVAGNLGATRIAASAGRIEAASRAGDAIAEFFPELDDAVAEMLAAIALYLSRSASSS